MNGILVIFFDAAFKKTLISVFSNCLLNWLLVVEVQVLIEW